MTTRPLPRGRLFDQMLVGYNERIVQLSAKVSVLADLDPIVSSWIDGLADDITRSPGDVFTFDYLPASWDRLIDRLSEISAPPRYSQNDQSTGSRRQVSNAIRPDRFQAIEPKICAQCGHAPSERITNCRGYFWLCSCSCHDGGKTIEGVRPW